MKHTVQADEAGMRLDQFVAAQLTDVSRAHIQKLLAEGKIAVNGETKKAGYKLKDHDVLEVTYDVASNTIADIDLPILYEDDDCIVINKPEGVLTHALSVHGDEPSVASFIRTKVKGIDGERAGIVHRLDRATSGVIIGAKSQAALSWLQKQFAQRKVKKTYIAVVEGAPKQIEATIDMPIQRNPKAPATFRVGANGKSAVTYYRVLAEGPKYSLVQMQPQTGRTHQLRVHMQKIGHPIVGDPLYGKGTFGDRLFLHAESLEITLPNRERKTFHAPLPPEFKKVAMHG